ncbi:MAG: DUF134 domain-containing protein [Calditrichaceae bacterium]|nr:DUF134 domain-containing protein [Calditrichaceae bacterium]MBN2709305.1 DUF134 domain-containing protein [Calditrichaceae bacterium]RQV91998.1 MAG: DUF134 domain-containing protein [Calditrichota bacterium]
MPGPYRRRRVFQPPNFVNFKPSGIPRRALKMITLAVDEYEAIRLADYNGLDHTQAAENMGISRPTFSRLVEKARNKIAQALVDGMELIVEGGNIEFANTRRRCLDCGDEYLSPYSEKINDCPECGSDNIEDIADNFIKKKNNENKRGDNV